MGMADEALAELAEDDQAPAAGGMAAEALAEVGGGGMAAQATEYATEAPSQMAGTVPLRAPEPTPMERLARGAKAFGSHAAQGASFFAGDEMMGEGYAAGGPEIPRATRGLRGVLTGKTSQQVGQEARRAELEQQEIEYPAASMAGDVAGAAAVTAPFAVAAGTMSPFALLTEGALVSAATGSGMSESETPEGRLRAGGEAAMVGGPANALIPGAASAAGRGAAWLGGLVRNKGRQIAEAADPLFLRAMGMERGAQKKIAQRYGGKSRYAQGLREQGVGEGFAPTTRTMTEQAEAAAERAGARRAELSAQLADAPIHGETVAQRIESELVAPHLGVDGAPLPGSERVVAELRAVEDSMARQGELNFEEFDRIRQSWGDKTKFDSGSVLEKQRKRVYGIINDSMAEAAEAAQPGAGRAWREAGEQQHTALVGQEAGENYLNTAGNRIITPSDYMSAAGGGVAAVAATGSPVAAALSAGGTALANRVIRGREHILASKAAERLGPAVERGGEALRSIARPLPAQARRAVGVVRRGALANAPEPAGGMSVAPADALALIEEDPNAFGPQTALVKAAAESGDIRAMNMAMLSR